MAFVIDCLVKLRQHIAQATAAQRISESSSSSSNPPSTSDGMLLDLLPPEHLREKFDVALNLLLRLATSLQDVFWGERTLTTFGSPRGDAENQTPPPSSPSSAPPASVTAPTAPQQLAEPISATPPGTTPPTDAAPSSAEAKPSDESTTAADEEQAEKDRQALRDFRDFFDAAGVKSLWRVLDSTLRDVELACPSLKLPTATSIESPIAIDQDASDSIPEASHRRSSEEFAPPRRARDVLRASDAAVELPGPTANETTPGALSPPLLVNQLLPLIDCYLLVQQVSIAAELELKATEVPRVIQSSSTNRGDAQLQQSFAESVSTVLLNPDARLLTRHADMLIFCERHRRILNLLIQQSPGMLSGAFQPLVALSPMCISFENKRLYFRQKLKQLREGTRNEPIRLNVRRNLVFMDSFHQLRIRNGEEMKGKMVVHFQGEEGVDAGGLTREWYAILAREMFNPDYALFR